MGRSVGAAVLVLGACVAVAIALVTWASSRTRSPTSSAPLATAPALVEVPVAAAPSVAPWDDPCPARMAPIEDDPTFGPAPGETPHALVVRELDALVAEGLGPMRELRARHHGAALDLEGSRLCGCAQRRNGSRANRLAGYVRRLQYAEALRASAVDAEVGLDADGLSDAEYERLERDPRVIASSRENEREMEWIELAGNAADDAFRCVDGERHEDASPSCVAVENALASLRR